jgi:protein required for attachment to host cells
MIVPNDTTVAVVDGRRLRLFRNKGVEPQIALVPLPDPELEVISQGSGSRHRSSPANPDARRITEDDFVLTAAEHLNREALAGKVASLVVIADPRTLGEMRRHLHASARGKVVGELAKDLTGHSVEEIQSALMKA